ncbi:DUF6049 family protein [Actinomyces urogenitalis]|uniref:DUF6049 family protein n=1 Tax=Actinomyces urogenitalis TaxID=103621 RepID=UPI001896FDF2|nr:DUF6049 family protein [Actinomyces urogenitalis]
MRLGRQHPARRRPSLAARARTIVAGVCAALALGLAPVATAGTAPSSSLPQAMTATLTSSSATSRTAEVVPGQVTMSVDSLSAEVLASDQDLTLTGTIANGSDSTLSGAELVARVQRSTEVTTAALSSWLAGERTGYLSTVASLDLDGELAPGAVRAFTLTVPAAELPFASTEQWGPRGVELALEQEGEEIATDRTIALWDAGVQVDATRVTAIVPVVASPAEMSLLGATSVTDTGEDDAAEPEPAPSPQASTAASAEPGEQTAPAQDADSVTTTSTQAELSALLTRVTGLLSLAGDGVVLAVDPALMEALGVSAGQEGSSATPSATGTAQASPASPSSPEAGEAGPEASSPAPSPAATTSSDSQEPSPATVPLPAAQLAELRRALNHALDSGSVITLPWADADLSALAHLGQGEAISSALTRSLQATSTWDGAMTTTVLATGALDTTTLAQLPQSVTTVVAQSGDLPVSEDLTYTPSGWAISEGRTVLVPDADLTAAIDGEMSVAADETDQPVTTDNELDTRQLIRANSAILTRQAPNRHRDLVVTVSRQTAAQTDPSELAARLGALLDPSWTTGQGLDALVAAAQAEQERDQVARAELPSTQTSATELTQDELDASRQTASYLASLASVLSSPSSVLGLSTEVESWASATSWRADPQGRSAYIDQARQTGTAMTERITVVPSSTINVISSSADLPLRIQSSLDQDVTVRIHLKPGSTRLQASKDVTVTVPAHGQASATVPIKAVGSGDVDVHITVLAADGTPVGTAITLHTRVRADWESLGTTAVAAVLVVMLLAGIVRTVRRGRRSGADGQALKAPAAGTCPSPSEAS